MRLTLITRLVALATLLTAIFSLPACAQATAPRSVTLSDAIAAALRQNPDLLIAASTVDSARAEHRIAGAIPNPTLAGVPNSPYQYSLTLPLDITPQRHYRTRAADIGTAAAEDDRRDAVRQTTLAVARAFFDAVLSEERRTIVGQRRDAVKQILAADSARYAAGDAPLRNIARSEVELARADADAARADVDVHSTRIALEALMGIAHADTSMRADGSLNYRKLDLPGDSLVALALNARPDRQATERRVDQSKSGEGVARSLLIPTPQLSLVRQFNQPFDNGNYYSLGLGFELPSLNLYGGQREKAHAGLNAAVIAERRSSSQVERDVMLSLADFRAQRDLVERYQSGVMDKMTQFVEAARYAYTKGATSLLEVLDAVRSEQDVRTEYVTALHDYWVSTYALNAAVGRDLFGVLP